MIAAAASKEARKNKQAELRSRNTQQLTNVQGNTLDAMNDAANNTEEAGLWTLYM